MADTGRPPKFLYVLPNFHNPAGTTLPFERRQRLAEIAARLNLPVVEDDPYGQLRFEGEDIVPIIALIPERTVYLSTFSKTLAPGLRLGWIICPEVLIQRLVQAKQGADLHTGTFIQYVANDICQRGLLKPHVKRLREAYKERRDTMLNALAELWPAGAGGPALRVACSCGRGCRNPSIRTEFLKDALAEKVARLCARR